MTWPVPLQAGAGAFAKVNTLLFVALFTAILTTFGSLLFMPERVIENIAHDYNNTGNCTKMDTNVPNFFSGNLIFHRRVISEIREKSGTPFRPRICSRIR